MQKISVALVKFQQSLKPVEKAAENPFYRSNYADLSSILQAVIPALSANGLAVIQPMRVIENGTILITRLIHESGESIESEMYLPHNPDPQKYGSLISYYKRYQLTALLGIATIDEDDDANKASGKDKAIQAVKPTATQAPKPPVNQPSKHPANQDPPPSFQVNGVQTQVPFTMPASEAQKSLLTKLGIYYSKDISKSEASKLIEQNNKSKKEGK